MTVNSFLRQQAFEAQKNAEDPKAIQNLKHMLLCKIMTDAADEVPLMLDGKLALKFSGPHLDAMRDIAKSYQERNLDKLIKAQVRNKVMNGGTVSIHRLLCLEAKSSSSTLAC